MDHLFSGGTPGFRNHVINMKCKQCNEVATLAQKYSSVLKKTAVNSERVTHESYIKLISWVALYCMPKHVQYLCASAVSILRGRRLLWGGLGRARGNYGGGLGRSHSAALARALPLKSAGHAGNYVKQEL